MKTLTEKQRNYLRDYLDGMTVREVAKKYGVQPSTVSRTIHRAADLRCPFGFDRGCERCVLPDCGLNAEAASYLEAHNTEPLDRRKRSELAALLASDSDT